MKNVSYDAKLNAWRWRKMVDGKKRVVTLLGIKYEGAPPTEPPPEAVANIPNNSVPVIKAEPTEHTETTEPSGINLATHINEWVNRVNRKGKSTKHRTQAVAHFLAFAKAENITRLDQINVKTMRRFVNSLQETHKDSTIRTTLGYLSKYYSDSISEEDFSGANPCTFARDQLEPVDESKILYYTDEEMASLLSAIRSDISKKKCRPWVYDYAVVLFGTMMRATAALNIEKSDCDFDKKVIYVKKEFSKNGRSYAAPMNKQVEEIIRAAPSEKIFPVKGSSSPYAAIKRVCERNNLTTILEKGRFNHTWRHSAGCNAVNSGTISLSVIGSAMGHAEGSKQTAHYSKVKDLTVGATFRDFKVPEMPGTPGTPELHDLQE